MKNLILAVCLSVTSVLASASVPTDKPDELVKALTEDVLEVLRSDGGLKNGDVSRAVESIEKIVLPHFDLRRMTMLAVGRDWRNATAEQQQRLINSFYDMLVRTYSNALTEYRNQTVAFRPLRMNPGDRTVRVQTEVQQPGGQPIPVDYMLEQNGKAWKVFDVVIAGVSLVTNYRGTFAQEIRAGGIDGLIRALETRGSEIAKAAEGKS
ncbi:MAG: ABC transporter substrate-binding protein [Pseudazoarcus pumilus]|nr:ABC transporter substrate-binding protein [Pseudazoarcus pumilus]